MTNPENGEGSKDEVNSETPSLVFLGHLHRRLLEAQLPQTPERRAAIARRTWIGMRTRDMRRALKVTQQDLAEHLAVDPADLSAFENGLVPISDLPEGFPRRLAKTLRTILRAQQRQNGNSSD